MGSMRQSSSSSINFFNLHKYRGRRLHLGICICDEQYNSRTRYDYDRIWLVLNRLEIGFNNDNNTSFLHGWILQFTTNVGIYETKIWEEVNNRTIKRKGELSITREESFLNLVIGVYWIDFRTITTCMLLLLFLW